MLASGFGTNHATSNCHFCFIKGLQGVFGIKIFTEINNSQSSATTEPLRIVRWCRFFVVKDTPGPRPSLTQHHRTPQLRLFVRWVLVSGLEGVGRDAVDAPARTAKRNSGTTKYGTKQSTSKWRCTGANIYNTRKMAVGHFGASQAVIILAVTHHFFLRRVRRLF